ncbi:hypothetical protein V6M85_08425 [Sulfolobus tengchongensis]|uniref:Uncharacterized protein n=1 Tax=Sulfolobus tengchongensis TaxID=207809 RepID=A0AAX4L016_9CREN
MNEKLFKEYERLRNILKDNLVGIDIINNEVIVYVKNKVSIQGYKVLDPIDYIKDQITSAIGNLVRNIEVKDDVIEVHVKDYTPQMFELISVIEYETNKKFNTRLTVRVLS